MKTTKGKFKVTGYNHLPKEAKKIVKNLNMNDELTLKPDPDNEFGAYAIKVFYKDNRIGWFSASGYRQREVFTCLINGVDVRVHIIDNTYKLYPIAQFEYEKIDLNTTNYAKIQ